GHHRQGRPARAGGPGSGGGSGESEGDVHHLHEAAGKSEELNDGTSFALASAVSAGGGVLAYCRTGSRLRHEPVPGERSSCRIGGGDTVAGAASIEVAWQALSPSLFLSFAEPAARPSP